MVLTFFIIGLSLCTSYGNGAPTSDIEKLSQDISNSIAHDLANAKNGHVIKATKQAVEKVKPQLMTLARLTPGSEPEAMAQELVQRVAAAPELAQPEQDGGLAPRARGNKSLNFLKSFLIKSVTRKG